MNFTFTLNDRYGKYSTITDHSSGKKYRCYKSSGSCISNNPEFINGHYYDHCRLVGTKPVSKTCECNLKCDKKNAIS